MIATIEGDMVTGRVNGRVAGIRIPNGLISYDIARLRYDGNAVVDASSYRDFFISPDGLKHITQSEPSWQSLTCSWNASLILDAGTWRVKNSADEVAHDAAEAYRRVRRSIYQAITITHDFPEWKQANYNQRYAELLVAELGAVLSAPEVTELSDFRLVRDWKDGALAERDRVKAAINSATDLSEITAAENSLNIAAPPFNL